MAEGKNHSGTELHQGTHKYQWQRYWVRRHLFRNPKQVAVIAQLQAIADRNIRRFKLLEKRGAAV